MVTTERFRKIALGFPDTAELPHFEKTSFRKGKKIFATLTADGSLACVKLSQADQSVFCLIDQEMIFPVENRWGLQGWTNVNLARLTMPILKDLLQTSYATIDSKSRSKK